MNALQLLIPDLPTADEIMPYLRQIDAVRWYTNFGPLVTQLEEALSRAFGVSASNCVSVSNCTLGLELALAASGLDRAAKVLMPALTFVASATAVLRAGLVPVLSDVDAENWLLTPEIARMALAHHQFDCVMPIATFGCPQPVAGWDSFTRDTGIPVIIDAAGAFGNQEIGELTTVVFSFHATKALGIGEGGLVVSRDIACIERIRQLSNFGIDLSKGVSETPGTNAKLSEYHAAVGLAALARWPARRIHRRKLAMDYADALRTACPGVTFQKRPRDGIYTIMQVLLPAGLDGRGAGIQLKSRGIETRSWYFPTLEMHPAFSRCAMAGQLTVTRKLASRMLGLPFHLWLSAEDIKRICQALADALTEF